MTMSRVVTFVVAALVLGLAGCSSGSNSEVSDAGSAVMKSSDAGVHASTSNAGGDAGNAGSSGTGSGGIDSGVRDAGIGDASTANGPGDDAAGGFLGTQGDLGVGNGSDVVLIGDSFMSNTLEFEGTGGGIAPALIQFAGRPYRNYAMQGVKMLQADVFGPAIPNQYEMAKRANPDIKTVIMTGGGNDILLDPMVATSCKTAGEACRQMLAQIDEAFEALWTEMTNDGVEDIVYVQYADNVGTVSPVLRQDAGVEPPSICFSERVRCHAVDTTAAVMGQIAVDGVHPLKAANQRIATQIYDLMVQDGMRR
jgi:hypothetical protein